jgi:hypothetical protein
MRPSTLKAILIYLYTTQLGLSVILVYVGGSILPLVGSILVGLLFSIKNYGPHIQYRQSRAEVNHDN